jgi:hypothetical protein
MTRLSDAAGQLAALFRFTRINVLLAILSLIASQIAGFPSTASANEEYKRISQISKLTYSQSPDSGIFSVKLYNVLGTSIGPVNLTLKLDELGKIQSTVQASFIRDEILTVNFPVSKEISSQINSLRESYSPEILIGDHIIKLPKFRYALNCYSKNKQEQIIGKDYPYPNVKVLLTLKLSCVPKTDNLELIRFTGDFTENYPGTLRGSTFDLSPKDSYQDTYQVKGEFLSRANGTLYQPFLRMLDHFGNSRVMSLNSFTILKNADWTKKYQSCIYSNHQKTKCFPFNEAYLEICSPLEDFKISKFDGKTWTRDPDIISGEKDLKRCVSTSPYFYIIGAAGNDSLKVSSIVRINFLATPTQKSQVWTFTIKNVPK